MGIEPISRWQLTTHFNVLLALKPPRIGRHIPDRTIEIKTFKNIFSLVNTPFSPILI